MTDYNTSSIIASEEDGDIADKLANVPIGYQLTPDDLLRTLEPTLENITHLQEWIYGSDLGFVTVSMISGRSLTTYQALANARRSLQLVRDCVSRRRKSEERMRR